MRYFVSGAELSISIKQKGEELIQNATYKDYGCEAFYNYLKSNKLIPVEKSAKDELAEEIFKLAIDASADLFYATLLRNKIRKWGPYASKILRYFLTF